MRLLEFVLGVPFVVYDTDQFVDDPKDSIGRSEFALEVFERQSVKGVCGFRKITEKETLRYSVS